MGVFPGMIVGTIVGFVRRGRLRVSPFVQKEAKLFRRGLLVPGILFLGLVIGHEVFHISLQDLVNKHVQEIVRQFR